MLLTMPISIRVRGGIESAQSSCSSGCSGAAAGRRLPVVRGPLLRRNGGRPPRGGAQRPIQVLDDVLDMLDADTEADRFGSNTRAVQLLRSHLPMRGGGRMAAERSGVADIYEPLDKFERVVKRLGRLQAAHHAQGQKRGRPPTEIFQRKRVGRMVGKADVIDPLDARISAKEVRDCARVLDMPF